MKFDFNTLLTVIFISVFFTSCKHNKTLNTEKNNIDVIKIKYAKGFEIQQFKDYKKLIIKSPHSNYKEIITYILYDKGISKKPEITNYAISVPIEKIVVTSTTHIPMLELLEVEKTLVGFPHTKYISSPKTRKLIDDKSIKEIGVKASLNTEIILNLQPTAVVGFSINKTNKSLNLIEKSGIPVILNGDWLEETPLGRAEWIKFFGVLYNKEKEADSIFNKIEINYLSAVELAKKSKRKPSVLSGAVMSKNIWNLPAGESFVARLLEDANTDYLWKNTKGKGSLSISFESALYKGQTADYWIAPGYFSSKEQMLKTNKHYREFSAFKNDKLYTYSNKIGATGGIIYFELGPTRPDLVLKDIIKIVHPDLLKDYTSVFFEKMN